ARMALRCLFALALSSMVLTVRAFPAILYRCICNFTVAFDVRHFARSTSPWLHLRSTSKMGLWQRIKRVFRANTGAALDKIENPELVLQQTIRDMRDRVPELNNSVAQVMATERLLQKNHENLEKQVVELDSKIKAAVMMGRDDIATAYIGQLQQAQLDRERTSAQLEHASLASQQALKARDNYVLNMKKRTAE